jgi:diaminopropionate ammonia-lyase
LVSDTALEEGEDDLGDEVPRWIVEGYETMFGEVEEQVREITEQNRVSLVVTPVGVGSLGQAVVTHFKDALRAQKTAIVAVEPVAAACLKTSLEKGTMTSIKTGYTICTGSIDSFP